MSDNFYKESGKSESSLIANKAHNATGGALVNTGDKKVFHANGALVNTKPTRVFKSAVGKSFYGADGDTSTTASGTPAASKTEITYMHAVLLGIGIAIGYFVAKQ